MAQAFNLTAQLNLRGPANIKQIAAQIKKDLGNINATVKFTIDPTTTKNVAGLNSALKSLNSTFSATVGVANNASSAIKNFSNAINSVNIKNIPQQINASAKAVSSLNQASSSSSKALANASSEMAEFGKQAGLAVRRFAAFSAVTSVIYGVTNSINQGVQSFIDYDKQLTRIQQVTGESSQGLSKLQAQITNLSTQFGVSSKELTTVALTLAQAGLSAKDTERSLKALALSSLAPSFDDMNETVEGSIALMRQFGIEAKDLEQALGAVNAVSARFAVEASDIITAIQRTGSVFATASKGVSEGKDALNEFIAVFTSVRATTRESAETIATGLRTIFTRIQRSSTIEALKEFGVNLTDAQGKFVGAYKAVELLSQGLSKIDPRSLDFSRIVEELGGFRQIGKVIPLIQQFSVAQEALSVAQKGQGSLARDATIAQKSLANQIAKVREEFLALFREIGSSKSFQTIVRGALDLTSALIKVTSSLKGLLPALSILMAFKGVKALTQFTAGFGQGLKKGPDNKQGSGATPFFGQGGAVRKFARGGLVPGQGNGDTVPAMLEPGEFVIRKKAVETIGTNKLHKMNKYAYGGKVKDLAKYYKSIPYKKNYENLANQPITDHSQFIEILPEALNKKDIQYWKQSTSLAPWQKFENLLARRYPVGKKASEKWALLDFPDTRSEAKFMKRGATYRDPDSLKGNNEETIAAKNFLYENSLLSGQKNIKPDKLMTRAIADKPIKTYWADPDKFKSVGLFKLGGKIQKFIGGGKTLGARSNFKELSQEEIYSLSTQELIKYAQAQARNIFSTGGAGMATGHEFIEVPANRIIPELEPDLVSYMGKRGFWREKVAPFARPTSTSVQKNTKLDKETALRTQVASHADEVAAREQQWTSITSGSAIDNYLLSRLEDPILSDYKTVRGGGSLAKPFHQTRLRKAVNQALEEYDDFDYSPENIDKLVSTMASKTFAYGGLVQKFEDGTTVEKPKKQISPTLQGFIDRIAAVGGTTRAKDLVNLPEMEKIIRSYPLPSRPSPSDLISSKWLGKQKPDQYGDRSQYLAPLKDIVELVEKRAQDKKELKQAQIARNLQAAAGGAYRFGLASIFGPKGEFGYSDVSDAKEIEGTDGTKYLTQIVQKSLPKRYESVIQKIKERLMSVPQNAAEELQYVDIFGTGGPLAFDFDQTLIDGADIRAPNGGIDIKAYNDLNRVQEALGNAELTPLGKELQKRIKEYPQLLDSIRVLTARPPSNSRLLAATLSRLQLPIAENKITGVNGGLNKVDNLSELETLIDDNLENLEKVWAGGKKAIQYQQAKAVNLGDRSSRKSIQVMEGYALEEMVRSLGVDISEDDADPNRPIDFPNGLGAYASKWDMPPTIPTDTKRTNSSNAVSRLFAEAERFYIQNFASGGKASRKVDFEAGVGPSPFETAQTNKLGSEVYDLSKGTNLSNGEFNQLVRFAKTNDYSIEQFKDYLAQYLRNKENKKNSVVDTEQLRQMLLGGTRTSEATPRQLALAEQLKGEPDAGYRPTRRFAKGGSPEDTVPALLTPGEFVINKKAAQKIGYNKLEKLNYADKIQGYNSGGIVGGIARFATGGNVGIPIFDILSRLSNSYDRRPEKIDKTTIGVDETTLNSVKDLVKALNDLGISAADTAEILNAGGRTSYQEIEKAMEKDIERMKLSGASIASIVAAESRLANVRKKSESDIQMRKNLEGAFASRGSASKKIAGGMRIGYLQDGIGAGQQAVETQAQMIAQSRIQLRGGKVSDEDRTKIMESSYLQAASRISGIKKSEFKNANITGADIQQYIAESMRDRKTLASMDKQLIALRMQEYANHKTVAGTAVSSAAEAKKLAEQEVSERREIINKLAAQKGETGVGGAGMFDFRNSPIVQATKQRYVAKKGDTSLMGLKSTAFSDLSLAAGVLGSQGKGISQLMYDTSSPVGKKQAVKTEAAIEQAGTTLSTGLMAASQALSIPVAGPWIAGLTAIGTAAFAAADYFYDFTGAQKAAAIALEKSINAAKLENATDKLDKAFSNFESDISNIDLQKALGSAFVEYNQTSSQAALSELKDAELKTNQSRTWFEWAAGASAPSLSNVNNQGKLDELARAEANRNAAAANKAASAIRSKINTGTTDINALAQDKELVKAYASGDVSVQKAVNDRLAIMAERVGGINNITADQRDAILAEEAARKFLNDAEIKAAIKSKQLSDAMEDADRAGRKLAQSFQRLFNSIDQSINRIQFESDQRSKLANARFAGLNGRIEPLTGVSQAARTSNILENRNAYTREQYQQAVASTTAMVPGQSGTILNDITMLDATLADTLNSVIAKAAERSKSLPVDKAAEETKKAGIAEINKLNVSDETKAVFRSKLESGIDKAQKDANDAAGGNQAQATDIFNEKMTEAAHGLGDFMKGSQEITKKLASLRVIEFDKFIEGINESAKASKEAAVLFKRARDITAQGQRSLKEVLTGQTESFGETKARLMNDVATLTNGPTDPAAIRQKIVDMSGQIATRQQQLDKAQSASLADPNNERLAAAAKTAAREYRDFTVELSNTREGLDLLAESTELLNKAMDDLRAATDMQKNRENFINQMLTNTPEEADKLNQTFIRLSRNLSGGVNNAFNQRDARKAYNDTLRQTGNANEAVRAGNTVLANQRKETLALMKDSGFRATVGLQMGAQNRNVTQAEIDKKLNDMELQLMKQMAIESGMMNNPLVRQAIAVKEDPKADPIVAARADRYLESVGLQAKATEEQAALKQLETTDLLRISNVELKMSIDNLTKTINAAVGRDQEVEQGKVQNVAGDNKVAFNIGLGGSLGATSAQTSAKGGIIYASAGKLINFEPKGTDTVPAMLSPGEFVVNARATAQHLPILQAINSGQSNIVSRGMSRGGVVYLAQGGRLKKDETIAQDRAQFDAEVQAQGDNYGVSPTDQQELTRLSNERIAANQQSTFMQNGAVVEAATHQWTMQQVGSRWLQMTDDERNAEIQKNLPIFNQLSQDYISRRDAYVSQKGEEDAATGLWPKDRFEYEHRMGFAQQETERSIAAATATANAEQTQKDKNIAASQKAQQATRTRLNKRYEIENARQIAYGEKEVEISDQGRLVFVKGDLQYIPWKPGEKEAEIERRKQEAFRMVNEIEQAQGLPLTQRGPDPQSPNQPNAIAQPQTFPMMGMGIAQPLTAAQMRESRRQAYNARRYARQQAYLSRFRPEVRERVIKSLGRRYIQSPYEQAQAQAQAQAQNAAEASSIAEMTSLVAGAIMPMPGGQIITEGMSTAVSNEAQAMAAARLASVSGKPIVRLSREDENERRRLLQKDQLDRTEEEQASLFRLQAMRKGLSGTTAEAYVALETRKLEDLQARRYKYITENKDAENISQYDLEFVDKYRANQARTQQAILEQIEASRAQTESSRSAFVEASSNNVLRNAEIKQTERDYLTKNDLGISKQDLDKQELAAIEAQKQETLFKSGIAEYLKTNTNLPSTLTNRQKAEAFGNEWASNIDGFKDMKPEEQQRLVLHYEKIARDYIDAGTPPVLSNTEKEQLTQQAMDSGYFTDKNQIKETDLIRLKFRDATVAKATEIDSRVYGGIRATDTRASAEAAYHLSSQARSLRNAAEKLSRLSTVDSTQQIADLNARAAELETAAVMSTYEGTDALMSSRQQSWTYLTTDLEKAAVVATREQAMKNEALDAYAKQKENEIEQERIAEEKRLAELRAAAEAEARAREAEIAARLEAEEQAKKAAMWVNSDYMAIRALGWLGGVGEATGNLAYGAANTTVGGALYGGAKLVQAGAYLAGDEELQRGAAAFADVTGQAAVEGLMTAPEFAQALIGQGPIMTGDKTALQKGDARRKEDVRKGMGDAAANAVGLAQNTSDVASQGVTMLPGLGFATGTGKLGKIAQAFNVIDGLPVSLAGKGLGLAGKGIGLADAVTTGGRGAALVAKVGDKAADIADKVSDISYAVSPYANAIGDMTGINWAAKKAAGAYKSFVRMGDEVNPLALLRRTTKKANKVKQATSAAKATVETLDPLQEAAKAAREADVEAAVKSLLDSIDETSQTGIRGGGTINNPYTVPPQPGQINTMPQTGIRGGGTTRNPYTVPPTNTIPDVTNPFPSEETALITDILRKHSTPSKSIKPKSKPIKPKPTTPLNRTRDMLIEQLSTRQASIYDIFGSKPGQAISLDEIKKLRQEGARWLHPDINKNIDPNLQKQLNSVLELASDEKAMIDYQKGISRGFSHEDLIEAYRGSVWQNQVTKSGQPLTPFSSKVLQRRRPDLFPSQQINPATAKPNAAPTSATTAPSPAPKLSPDIAQQRLAEIDTHLNRTFGRMGGGKQQHVRAARNQFIRANSGEDIINKYGANRLNQDDIAFFRAMTPEEAQKFDLMESISYGGMYDPLGGMLNARKSARGGAFQNYAVDNNLSVDQMEAILRTDAWKKGRITSKTKPEQIDNILRHLSKTRDAIAIEDLLKRKKELEAAVSTVPINKSSGGIIYANNGALAMAQGSDTVPAMLTPGEFVVNRDSAQKYMPVLHAINSGHFSRGGIVNYLANGGVVAPKYYAGGTTVPVQGSSSGSGVSNTVGNNIGAAISQALDGAIGQLSEFASSITTGLQQSIEQYGQISQTMNQSITTFSKSASKIETSAQTYEQAASNIPSNIQTTVTGMTNHTGLDRLTGNIERDIYANTAKQSSLISQNSIAHVDKTSYEGSLNSAANTKPMGK